MATALTWNRARPVLRQLSDLAATQLLSIDDDAAALALFVEELAKGVERPELLRALLRHNLLLDGTFLRLLGPILTQDESEAPDISGLDDGERTMVVLFNALLDLRDGSTTPPSDDVDELIRRAPELEPLRSRFDGKGAHEERMRFVVLSYSLFLEAFLLRASVGLMDELVSSTASAPEPVILPSTLEDADAH